ncbi:MAG: phenylalanine--tRNA ligase subunit beta [Deltaproteobacteria bacterium]|nr:phenylalanine--tRNA ligase subunit beta [Deltaproteobacteria bacterium]
MKVSVAWLRALIPSLESSSSATLDTRAIAARLTGAGLEVEAIHRFGEGLEPVVIARVTGVRPHPTRSGLQLVTVDRGNGSQEVICGAKNVPLPGGLVVLAPLGAVLPAAAGGRGMTIAARTIAGVVSEGMLCSESELGIAFGAPKAAAGASGEAETQGDAGILVLPEEFAAPGTPLRDAIPTVIDDILEIGVTPNRPDALGHVGVARELAALLDVPWRFPTASTPERVDEHATADVARVSIDEAARARCPHYGSLAVFCATIGPSPLWIRYRLHALGVRSISNVVDVTNLVMLEYGHPLHAFDLDRLEGPGIHVRLARPGEEVVTLDGEKRALVADDLVICDGGPDGGKPVALAGVMGAGNSEISAGTKRVLIECAYFDPRTVRRTARRHGLHTESSHRFERGVDPAGVASVLAQAGALTVHLAHGAAAKEPLHVVASTPTRTEIPLRHSRLERLLGAKIEKIEARGILERLGCELPEWSDDAMMVRTPTHRPDLGREVDLIEEIARVRGFDSIPTETPAIRPQPPRAVGVAERRARHAARDLGLSEAVSYGFASPRDLEILGAPAPVVHLQNPLGEERSVMRTSLLPGLLAALRRSRHRGERRVRLFEVGMRFLAGGPEAASGLCDEVPSVAVVLAGPRDTWLGQGDEVDVWDAKGIATEMVSRMSGAQVDVVLLPADARPPHLHPRGAAAILAGIADRMANVGTLGPLHPDVVEKLELDGTAMVVELDLRAIEALGTPTPKFQALPAVPASTRDVALEVDEALLASELSRALREGAGALCASVEVFDVYRGKGVSAGRKSVAFRLTYRDPNGTRTLTDAEVDASNQKAVAATKPLGAVQRA